MVRRLLSALLLFFSCLPLNAMANKCRIADYPYEIDCGTFEVKNPVTGMPENIAWRRVEARARYPHPDPIIWIPGGLGVDATDRAPGIISMLSRLQNSRDLIWIDILGSGSSSELSCAKPARSRILERIDIFSNSSVLKSCHNEITRRGGTQIFNYQLLARHYEQLRQLLKLGKVNVVAEGLGSNIALAWDSSTPKAVRSMVLDSPPPLQKNSTMIQAKFYARALENVTISCKQDKDCDKYHPDMASYLQNINAKLPRDILLTNPQSGLKERVKMDEETFAQMLMSILRTPTRAAALPNVLHAASGGNWQPIIGLSSLSWAKLNTRFSYGLWLASLCGNGRASPDIKLHGNADWFYRTQKNRMDLLCRGKWGTEVQYALPEKTPVLILAPLADPLAGGSFNSGKNVNVIQIPGASSGVMNLGCARDVIYHFIAEEEYQQDEQGDACLTNFPLPPVGPVNRFGWTP